MQNLECCCFHSLQVPVRKGEKTTCSSMLTRPACYELQMLRVYTQVHGGRGYDYTRTLVLKRIIRALALNWP